ncbi:MAG: [FeFe] hydrogenase, group A [Bacteroidales bacterium]|jgi:iron-only hydrogenase group A|nr:[FeFe] hydrogenase, group A [Bacteroidales bacterium]
MQFDIEINKEHVTAKKGETIKNVLDRIGIKVPTLCYMNGFSPTGNCRMCVVEVDGIPGLVPSCSHPVEEWMKIRTHSPRVIKARKTLVELLLASHPNDCLYCERNGQCELQALAAELDVRERKYQSKRNSNQIDKACPSIERDTAKCVLCGRCIRICDEIIGVGAIDVIGRGSESRIGTTYNKGLNVRACVKCGQCIQVCPTGALSEKQTFQSVIEVLNNPDLYPVIQFSPTVPASIAEEFNLKTNKDILNLFRAALKKMGFRQIFDTSMAADLTIMEEAAEFTDRFNKHRSLPMFTSCCPSWVKFVEDIRPKFLENLSSARSPQQMMGRLIKQYITSSAGQKSKNVFIVSVMPCTAKKYEAGLDNQKESEVPFVDAVITTRELIKMIRLLGIDFSGLEPEPNDSAFSIRSSAGKLFGISGGHLEGVLRTIGFMMTGQEMNPLKINDLRGLKSRKETRIKIGKHFINVVSVSGLANVKTLLDEIEAGRNDIHLVEVMTCPFGCINGGGQPKGSDEKSLKMRMKTIYDVDEEEIIKVAHKNPIIKDLYEKFLAKPNSDRNKELLHVSRCPVEL